MPDDQDSLEPTIPAHWPDVTESSPTIKERRAALVSSPQLGSKFEILGYIGRGGMGTVFKVRHRKLDHVRAVKVLPSGASSEMVERLRREASIATDLTHPNIVTVYDLEELGDGSLAIVMEYLRGTDLDSHIKRNGRMEVREVRQLFLGVADALDQMHTRGVVHRDIKPANLYLCDDGTLKVLDFGISRLVESDSGLTRTGAAMGTPSFMSPEQFEGYPATGKTDIYSLGAVLFYCLTGEKPFTARTQIELITRILANGAPRADKVCSAVPAHAANAIERALAIEPEDRWATASQLLDALVSEETRAMEVVRKGDSGRRKWWQVGLALAAVAAVAVVVAIGLPWVRGAGNAGDTDTGGAAAADVPVRGGTLRMGISARFPSMDPLVAKTDTFLGIQALLYDSLVGVDWRGDLTPALAESWERLDGDRGFLFHLRTDAVLHDDPCLPDGKGHPIDARDVQRSLERTFRFIHDDEDSTWKFLPPVEGFQDYVEGRAEHPSGIRIVDDHTIEVRFTHPAPSFAHCLCRPEWFIVAAEAIDEYGPGDVGFRAVGSGPFRVESASSDQAVLVVHENAWHRDARDEKLPYLDRIEISTYLGHVSAKAALKQGDVDLLLRLPPDALDEAMALDPSLGRAVPREGWEGYQSVGYLDEARRILMVMLFDRHTDKPYSLDEQVRRAVSVAIRRHDIATDPIIPTMGPLVDGMLGYEPTIVGNGDTVTAARLLEEAGYPGGEGLPPVSMCCREGMRGDADQMAEHLAAVGLQAQVSVVQYDTWLQYLMQGGCDLVLARFDEIVVNDDPTTLLSSLASRARIVDRRPELAELVDALPIIADRDEKARKLQELNHALVDDAMIIFLSYRSPGQPIFTNLASSRVRGLADPGTGLHNPRAQRMRQLWKQSD